MPHITRRSILIGSGAGAVGLLGAGGALAWRQSGGTVEPSSEAVRLVEAARRTPGQKTVTARLEARPVSVNLGGRVVQTWAYGDSVPGPLLRAQAGDLLQVRLDNKLPVDTSIHWHGIALRNDMDGVPGVTQDPIRAGESFTYEFTAPHPGTYFFHPHSGVQLDRGLYAALVIDDPAEPGAYDDEWIVVLDDWVDGTGRTPDDILEKLLAAEDSDESMSGMDHGSMPGMDEDSDGGMDEDMDSMEETMVSPLLGGAGDVDYPHYLVNGRTADAPAIFSARPGQRIRLRIINAGSDTAFRLALGGHRMTVTHSDGFPVRPVSTDALLIGMGERFDAVVRLGDGVFPLVASAEGKQGQGLAVVRTGAGRMPAGTVRPRELSRKTLLGTDLVAARGAGLPSRDADRVYDVVLSGTMAPYRWTINGKTFPDTDPLPIAEGERVRLRFQNRSTMFHPMHVHGHTFGLAAGGARKDTVVVLPRQTVETYFDADNPGQWATHCHNIYHAEAGMTAIISYEE